jgi:carbamoyltransferase
METFPVIEYLDRYGLPEKGELYRMIEQENPKSCYLGIGALSHDTSAAIVDMNGKTLYAVSEERLTNVKHDSRFPIGALIKCIKYANINKYKCKGIALSYHTSSFFEKLLIGSLKAHVQIQEIDKLINYLQNHFLKESSFSQIIEDPVFCDITGDHWENVSRILSYYYNYALKYKKLKNLVERVFDPLPFKEINHHDAHALAAVHASGFSDAGVLVVDGHGEYQSTTLYEWHGNNLTKVSEVPWPNSLGSLYLLATRFLGYDYGDEYKVMGMGAYGSPKFKNVFDNFISVNGLSFSFNENEFIELDYVGKTGQFRYKFSDSLRDIIPGVKNGELTDTHFDFAATIQVIIEEVISKLSYNLLESVKSNKMVVAGGVGLNGLANDRIRKLGNCQEIYIYPASGDDGTSVGAALSFVDSSALSSKQQIDFYFGYKSTENEIKKNLDQLGIVYEGHGNIHVKIAEALGEGHIVARYCDRAEFGPRALGNRSILADPSFVGMKDILNTRIKHREKFRPFAPACLLEDAPRYFDLAEGEIAPFMIMIVEAKEVTRKEYPEIVHHDGTGRVQTVIEAGHPDFYQILKQHKKLWNREILINTSFNVNGETIVDSEQDAIESFLFMDIDFLAIGDFWVEKKKNSPIIKNLNDFLQIRRARYFKNVSSNLTYLDCRLHGEGFLWEGGS